MEDGQLSCCLSGRSLQGTLHHHAAREGPGPGEATSEIHQDHEGNCGSVPRALQLCLGRLEPSALCCPYPYHCLSAAPAQAEQLQLLPGHPLSSGLSTHPQAGVAEANLRGGWWEVWTDWYGPDKNGHGSPSGHPPLCDQDSCFFKNLSFLSLASSQQVL